MDGKCTMVNGKCGMGEGVSSECWSGCGSEDKAKALKLEDKASR